MLYYGGVGVTTMGNVTVQPTTADVDITYIAAGVGGAGGLLVMALVVGVGVVIVLRFKLSEKGKYNCALCCLFIQPSKKLL